MDDCIALLVVEALEERVELLVHQHHLLVFLPSLFL
jgi:hypothetical protein